MQPISLQMLRRTGALTAALLSLPQVQSVAAEKTDAFPSFDSYVKIAGQSAAITGDGAAFQSRTGQSENFGGGIEELHYVRDLTKDTTMQMDGRALTGAEDYLLKFNVAKSEVGSVDVGYQNFRTFYDGVGGFFPNNSAWLPLNDQELFVDRGKFWAEVKIARPDQPEFTFRYVNETRDGRKDSTIWGTTTVTGVAGGTSTTRNINSSFIDLNERHQSLEGTMKQTVGNTTYTLSLLGDWVDNLDSRYVTNMPLAAPATQSNVTHTDGTESSMGAIMASTTTELTDQVAFNTGLRYQNVDNRFTGDRSLVSGTGVTTYNYFDLVGDATADIYTGILGFDFKPTPDWVVSPGVRAEHRKTSADATYKTGTPALPVQNFEDSRNIEDSLTPMLDVRYTGIRTLALYGSAAHKVADTDKRHVTGYTTVRPNPYVSDVDEQRETYKLGANWRQSSVLTVRCEVFYKDNNYTDEGTIPAGTDSYYELGSQFAGGSITAILKPVNSLSFTTRYLYQKGKRQVTHFNTAKTTLLDIDSMDAEVHSISETVDWTPINQFYMQASANAVFDVMSTSYAQTGVPANNVLQNSDNNYVTFSVLAGFVLTKRDDLQIQSTYYRAANGNDYLAANTQPYGVNESEFTVSVGLVHKVSDHFIANAKVGYFEHKNDTTGGHTDYRGPLAYVSLTYGL